MHPDVERVVALTAIAEKEKFVPSKDGLDEHHKAANAFWGKQGKGYTVDDSPEAKARIRERFDTGQTIDDILPGFDGCFFTIPKPYITDDPVIDLDDYYAHEEECS